MQFSPKNLLRSILSNTYSQADLRDFVQLCYFLALPLVRKRISQGKINLNLLGLQERDVVYDCIADLFLRSDDGNLPKIRAYMDNNGVDITNWTNERLLPELRRLVFGKVHNNLIRLLGEVDPTLGKILRNIRLALEKSESFVEMERFGESYIVSNRVEPQMWRPPMPFDLLEQGFLSVASPRSDVPSLLGNLWEFLSSQVEYQRAVSIVTAGLLFKSLYQRFLDLEVNEEQQVEMDSPIERIQRLIHISCRQLHQDMQATYVTSGKTTADDYDKYFCVLEEILLDRAKGHGDGLTYFDYLKRQYPHMKKTDYRKNHKKILEYLVRAGKARISKRIKNW